MGNSPYTSVQPAKPLINAGVDFGEAEWIQYEVRGKRPQIVNIAVLACFSTKTFHMEIASDVTTDTFYW